MDESEALIWILFWGIILFDDDSSPGWALFYGAVFALYLLAVMLDA